MYYYRSRQNSDALAAKTYVNEQLKKQSEKQDAITLKELGKFSAFKEVFEGIALEEQDFSYVSIAGNITTNQNFIEGRTFGFALIENGFTQENYNKYVTATSTKKHR